MVLILQFFILIPLDKLPFGNMAIVFYLVINRLSQPSWREAHKGKWGSFHCTSIRVGDYECTGAGSGGGGKRNNEVRTMMFSKFGIYFRSPHFTVKSTCT